MELTVFPHLEHRSPLSIGLFLMLAGPFVPVPLLGDFSPSPVLCKSLTKVSLLGLLMQHFTAESSLLRVHK